MELAQRIFSRLTEVEKITIRAAHGDRLDYLADTIHRVDLPDFTFDDRCAILAEVKALCMLEMATKSASIAFEGQTWKF